MAIVKVGRSSKRPATLRPHVMLSAKNGGIVASSWPRKRGPSKLVWQRAQIRRVRWIQKAIKTINAEERALMKRSLDEYLAKNRGVRGTSAIRERDFQTSNAAGRLYRPEIPPGRALNPAVLHADASDILDWLEPRIGSMVVRTENGWLPTVNCKPGNVLVMTLSTWKSKCCPNASIPPAHLAMGGHLE